MTVHIKILKPNVHRDEYINRKRFASINIQATSNSKACFTSVDASWPGFVNDSRIWKNSHIRTKMMTYQDCDLIADSGYGIEPYNDPLLKSPK